MSVRAQARCRAPGRKTEATAVLALGAPDWCGGRGRGGRGRLCRAERPCSVTRLYSLLCCLVIWGNDCR